VDKRETSFVTSLLICCFVIFWQPFKLSSYICYSYKWYKLPLNSDPQNSSRPWRCNCSPNFSPSTKFSPLNPPGYAYDYKIKKIASGRTLDRMPSRYSRIFSSPFCRNPTEIPPPYCIKQNIPIIFHFSVRNFIMSTQLAGITVTILFLRVVAKQSEIMSVFGSYGHLLY